MSDCIEEIRHGRFVELALNRPEAYNALNYELLGALAERMIVLAGDKRVAGIALTGRGRAFCAGGDLKYITGHPDGVETAFRMLAGQVNLAVIEMRKMAKPVVAAINGAAAGAGFTLALAADFRVMDKNAVMRQIYTSNGLCLDGGGSFMLPRIIGLARAMEIAAFDDPINAGKALEWGLVTRISDEGQALDGALNMLEEIAGKSLHSFGWAKKLFMQSFETPFETQVELERIGIAACGIHPDGQEGIRAFVEKRKPVFNRG